MTHPDPIARQLDLLKRMATHLGIDIIGQMTAQADDGDKDAHALLLAYEMAVHREAQDKALAELNRAPDFPNRVDRHLEALS